jgi:hypothetical protein
MALLPRAFDQKLSKIGASICNFAPAEFGGAARGPVAHPAGLRNGAS